MAGDHRRCGIMPWDCEVSQTWHADVIAAGRAAMAEAGDGHRWAVVSIHDHGEDRLRVWGTRDSKRAAGQLWHRAYRASGADYGAEGHGLVYIVTPDDRLPLV